jgi:hypothetical protein
LPVGTAGIVDTDALKQPSLPPSLHTHPTNSTPRPGRVRSSRPTTT